MAVSNRRVTQLKRVEDSTGRAICRTQNDISGSTRTTSCLCQVHLCRLPRVDAPSPRGQISLSFSTSDGTACHRPSVLSSASGSLLRVRASSQRAVVRCPGAVRWRARRTTVPPDVSACAPGTTRGLPRDSGGHVATETGQAEDRRPVEPSGIGSITRRSTLRERGDPCLPPDPPRKGSAAGAGAGAGAHCRRAIRGDH